MDFNQYLKDSFNFTDYLRKVNDQLHDLEQLDKENEFIPYYNLNIKRMERLNKTFQLTDEQKSQLKSIQNNFKILTISEGWCGDAAQILPVVNAMAEGLGVEHKIVLRDDNLELIDQFLTNGSRSIPIIIGLDENNKVMFTYGPRPKYGMELTRKFQEDPVAYPKDEFHKDVQLWYNEDKGQSIFNELFELMQ